MGTENDFILWGQVLINMILIGLSAGVGLALTIAILPAALKKPFKAIRNYFFEV